MDVGTGVNCVSWGPSVEKTPRPVAGWWCSATNWRPRAATDPDGGARFGRRRRYPRSATWLLRPTTCGPLGEILRESLQQLESRCRAYASGQPVGGLNGPAGVSIPIRAAGVAGSWSLWPDVPVWARASPRLHFMASAARQGTPVCFFSLEMRDTQLSDRLLIGRSNVDANAYRAGSITSEVMGNAGNGLRPNSRLCRSISATVRPRR